jgi:hypothetical protein
VESNQVVFESFLIAQCKFEVVHFRLLMGFLFSNFISSLMLFFIAHTSELFSKCLPIINLSYGILYKCLFYSFHRKLITSGEIIFCREFTCSRIEVLVCKTVVSGVGTWENLFASDLLRSLAP